jgi:RimJ/RimL family protein N-acetyltransferase
MFPDPPLSDGELRLRSWNDADVPALVAAGADPTVRQFRDSVPDSADAARDWLARLEADRRDGRRLELAIAPGDGGAMAAGSIGIEDFQQHNAMITYWLVPAAAGMAWPRAR